MFKGEICDQNSQYECGHTDINPDKLCPSEGPIRVVQVTDRKFDMKLTLPNAVLNDAGVYTVRVKVVNPDSAEVSFFSRTFEVHMIGKS